MLLYLSVLGNCTLFSRHTSFFVFPILYLSIEIDQNRSKSIKINHNRTKSIITRNCVIDFYRFPIFVDWFVSTTIDNNRILSTIRIIDMLRPVKQITLCCCFRKGSVHRCRAFRFLRNVLRALLWNTYMYLVLNGRTQISLFTLSTTPATEAINLSPST